MASPNDEKSIEVTIVEASHLPYPTFSRHRTFVEMAAGNHSRRTHIIKMKKDVSVRWDTQFPFPCLDGSTNIVFSVFCDSIGLNKCLGRVKIGVRTLLQRQAEGDVILPLVDNNGNPSAGQLAVQVIESSARSVIEREMEQARKSDQRLSSPQVVKVTDAVTIVKDAVSDQEDLVTSFGSLVDKMAIVVKVGEEVPQILPYVNFAWAVLNTGFEMVKAQEVRDQKISGLVSTMEDTYSLVAFADELKANYVLQDIVQDIEANDRMWFFHSGVYTTQLWREDDHTAFFGYRSPDNRILRCICGSSEEFQIKSQPRHGLGSVSKHGYYRCD
jgi:hypothetical protein